MAEPARRHEPQDTASLLDPHAVERAYRRQRAKRRANLERNRQRRWARVRFWLILITLAALTVYLTITVWQQIQTLFGL